MPPYNKSNDPNDKDTKKNQKQSPIPASAQESPEPEVPASGAKGTMNPDYEKPTKDSPISAKKQDSPAPVAPADGTKAPSKEHAKRPPTSTTKGVPPKDGNPLVKPSAPKKIQQAIAGKEEEAKALAEEIATEVNLKVHSLAETVAGFAARLGLPDTVSENENLNRRADAAKEKVQEVRSKGYTFRDYLEQEIEQTKREIDSLANTVEGWLEKDAPPLHEQLAEAQALSDQAKSHKVATTHTQSLADELHGIIESLESTVKGAEESFENTASDISTKLWKIESSAKEIREFTKIFDEESSFSLDGGESIYLAAEAEWKDGDDSPDGYLYVTNRRVIFEQKEKVGKKFGMFGGDDVHKILWSVDIPVVQGVEGEEKGLGGGTDLVHFSFGGSAPVSKATIEVKGSAQGKEWAQYINNLRNGTPNAPLK